MESEPRKDDEFERTVIADNYARLARAVVVRACLDMIALQHPGLMRRYIWNWRHSMAKDDQGRPVYLQHYPLWMEQERAQIEGYLCDGGGDLATELGIYDLVYKVRYYKYRQGQMRRTLNVVRKRSRQFQKLMVK